MLNNRVTRATQTETPLQAEDELPEPFKCPISWEPMSDPVFASDGHVYERQNMQTWFEKGSRTSPQTNEPLPDARLVTAWPIRKLMDAHPQARLYLQPPQQEKSGSVKIHPFPLAPPPEIQDWLQDRNRRQARLNILLLEENNRAAREVNDLMR